MKTITVSEESLLELINEYNQNQENYSKASAAKTAIEDKTSAFKQPIALSIKEYDSYRTEVLELAGIYKKCSDEYKDAENRLRNSKDELIRILPANQWFKVGALFIGVQTNNWPGKSEDIRIQDTMPEYPLEHITYTD
jgi:septal ring factor EnvC (AmiA/AmiB activator)